MDRSGVVCHGRAVNAWELVAAGAESPLGGNSLLYPPVALLVVCMGRAAYVLDIQRLRGDTADLCGKYWVTFLLICYARRPARMSRRGENIRERRRDGASPGSARTSTTSIAGSAARVAPRSLTNPGVPSVGLQGVDESRSTTPHSFVSYTTKECGKTRVARRA